MLTKHQHRTSIRIDLSKCQDPKDICAIMQHWGIKDYVYAFEWQGKIVKYGHSADLTGAPGERIYRQAGHLAGWRRGLHGSSGGDMRVIRMDFQNKYQHDLDRNEVTIWVLDMTQQDDDSDYYNAKTECCELERYLIDECVKRCGAAPIGNRDRETQKVLTQAKNQELLDRFFEFK